MMGKFSNGVALPAITPSSARRAMTAVTPSSARANFILDEISVGDDDDGDNFVSPSAVRRRQTMLAITPSSARAKFNLDEISIGHDEDDDDFVFPSAVRRRKKKGIQVAGNKEICQGDILLSLKPEAGDTVMDNSITPRTWDRIEQIICPERADMKNRRNDVTISSKTKVEDAVLETKLTPRTWDCIEQTKRQHDEELDRIQSMMNNTPKQSRYEATAIIPRSRYDQIMITTSNDEENVPFSPTSPSITGSSYQAKQRLEYIKKQHEKCARQMEMEMSSPVSSSRHFDLSTPRLPQQTGKLESEVQLRIDAMREQHKKNMDKMLNALEDAKHDSSDGRGGEQNHDHGGYVKIDLKCAVSTLSPIYVPDKDHPLPPIAVPTSSKDENPIAEGVGLWKLNAKQFETANNRFARWKTTSNTASPSPRFHHIRRNHHVNFDETTSTTMTRKNRHLGTSPRDRSMQELMMKNKELEEEMMQIRLLGPKNTMSPVATGSTSLSVLGNLTPTPPVSVKKDLLEFRSTALDGTSQIVKRIEINPGSTHIIHLGTPSSARYSTPRNNDHGLLYATKDSLSRRSHKFQTMTSNTDAQTAPMNTRIPGLIAGVKSFLKENDRIQD